LFWNLGIRLVFFFFLLCWCLVNFDFVASSCRLRNLKQLKLTGRVTLRRISWCRCCLCQIWTLLALFKLLLANYPWNYLRYLCFHLWLGGWMASFFRIFLYRFERIHKRRYLIIIHKSLFSLVSFFVEDLLFFRFDFEYYLFNYIFVPFSVNFIEYYYFNRFLYYLLVFIG